MYKEIKGETADALTYSLGCWVCVNPDTVETHLLLLSDVEIAKTLLDTNELDKSRRAVRECGSS